MYGKRRLIPIVVLIVAVLACSLFPDLPKNPDPPKNTEPDVARKDGECSDPRFKEAELAAYRALVQAQTDAANVLTNEINSIEARYKDEIKKLNDDYQRDLKACKDTSCTEGAKADYDKFVARAQVSHDDGLYIAQGKEQAAKEASQAMYYEAVEKARQLFCTRGYTAVSAMNTGSVSGVVCNWDQPFTVTLERYDEPTLGGIGTYTETWVFTPTSPLAGTTSITNGNGGSGSGVYSDSNQDRYRNPAEVILVVKFKIMYGPDAYEAGGDENWTDPVGGSHGGGFTFVPLETDECS